MAGELRPAITLATCIMLVVVVFSQLGALVRLARALAAAGDVATEALQSLMLPGGE